MPERAVSNQMTREQQKQLLPEKFQTTIRAVSAETSDQKAVTGMVPAWWIKTKNVNQCAAVKEKLCVVVMIKGFAPSHANRIVANTGGKAVAEKDNEKVIPKRTDHLFSLDGYTG
jgi:hypothetical protein